MVGKKTEQSHEMIICIKSKEKSEEFLKKVILDNYLLLVGICKYTMFTSIYLHISLYAIYVY